MIDKLAKFQRVYVDTNIFIYLVQGHEELGLKVSNAFQACEELNIDLYTSEITIAECLMGLFKQKNHQLISLFQDFFFEAAKESLAIVPITAEVLQQTPSVGARYKLKIIDSLHLATAQLIDCDGFLTNDKGFVDLGHNLKKVEL